jgi:hypothetical protein
MSRKLPFVLLAAMVAVNAVLAWKLWAAKKEAFALRREFKIVEGVYVPPLVGETLDGSLKTIDYTRLEKPVLLYVFSPQCGACDRNIANIRALAEAVGDNYHVTAVALERGGLEPHLRSYPLNMEVITNLPYRMFAAYHFSITPSTLVVSPNSTVQRVWYGAYSGAVQASIERYFHVKLPGMNAPAM